MEIQGSHTDASSSTRGQSRSEAHHRATSFSRSREGASSVSASAQSSASQVSSVGRRPSRRQVHGHPGAVATAIPGNASSVPGASTSALSAKKRRDRHAAALESIRDFLKGRSSYDGLPVSFRLVVLDTKLVVKPALDVMWQAGVVSAPLWQSTAESTTAPTTTAPFEPSAPAPAEELASTHPPSGSGPPLTPASDPTLLSSASPFSNALSLPTAISLRQTSPGTSPSPSVILSESAQGPTSIAAARAAAAGAPPPGKAGFAGMLTVNDIIHLIQYYYHHSSYDNAAQDVERFRLEMLRDIEQALNVPQPPLLSIEPMRPLYEACELLIKTHARRLPLLDYDEQTGMETVISVLTQYRVLKFIAMNCRETAGLHRTIRALGIGTYVSTVRGVGSVNASTSVSQQSSRPPSSAARGSVASPSQGASSRRSSDQSQSQFSSNPQMPPVASPGAVAASLAPQGSDLTTPTGGEGEDEKGQNFSAPTESSGGSGPAPASSSVLAQQYEPLATATLDTTVFDVVHMFSERGISAVPILDSDGYVVDLYEAVDVIDLVRTGAYQSLDLTIRQALARRPKDFGGVMTCGPDDSLASIFSLLRHRRIHRLVILEPEPFSVGVTSLAASLQKEEQQRREREEEATAPASRQRPAAPATAAAISGEEPRKRGRGKLVGILCLSDILKYVIGAPANTSKAGGAGIGGTPLASQRGSRSHSGTSGGAASGVSAGEVSSKVRLGSVSGGSSVGAGHLAGSEAESNDVGPLEGLPSTFEAEDPPGESISSSLESSSQQQQPQQQQDQSQSMTHVPIAQSTTTAMPQHYPQQPLHQIGAGQSIDVPSTIQEHPSKEEGEAPHTAS